ncbi:MAG: AAA family ATPase [Pyrinomonadaceae bacterium]
MNVASSQTNSNLIITHYDYVDENGNVLYQVCRTIPKGFFQRQPDGKGGWLNNITGVRRVLYRLPELLAADRSETVYICEGEKDCDALRKLGLVVTTNAGGAEKWRDEYNESLRGRNVVVLPDNDDVGRKHARQVATSLYNIAASIKIVELPDLHEKGDVSDWLEAGGKIEQLQAMVESEEVVSLPLVEAPDENQCSDYTETVKVVCMADVVPEDVSWLWYPYIAYKKLTIVEGEPSVGKSWATCAIATAVSTGLGLPNELPSQPRNVLMMSAEDGLNDTLRPRLDSMNADVSRIFALDGSLVFDTAGMKKLESYIVQYNPALVIIDPLFAYTGGKMDIYRDNEVRTMLANLKTIAEKHDCAIIAVRHLTKQQTGKAINAGAGSIAIAAAARSVLLFGRDDEGNSGFVQTKNNLAPFGEAVGYKIEEEQFSWTGESNLTASKILLSQSNIAPRATKQDEAVDFLRRILREGEVESEEVERLAKDANIKSRTLARAKATLGVKSERINNKWFMKLSISPSESFGDVSNLEQPPERQTNQECQDSAVCVIGGVDTLEGSNSGLKIKNVTPPKDIYKRFGGLDGGELSTNPQENTDFEWEERAAIMEFEGGLSRTEAESWQG